MSSPEANMVFNSRARPIPQKKDVGADTLNNFIKDPLGKVKCRTNNETDIYQDRVPDQLFGDLVSKGQLVGIANKIYFGHEFSEVFKICL